MEQELFGEVAEVIEKNVIEVRRLLVLAAKEVWKIGKEDVLLAFA
jgi:hypothetical protein